MMMVMVSFGVSRSCDAKWSYNRGH